jgi:hypothetical protein
MSTFELDDVKLTMVIAALKEKLDREWQYRMALRLAPRLSARQASTRPRCRSLPR